MISPSITKATRGCLVHFIKGHLLEESFDKTFLHYFGIDGDSGKPDFELWTKSSLSYLSERDLILLLNYRGRLVTKRLEDNCQTRQIEFLEWCESIKSSPLKSQTILEAIAIWKAHTLLLLSLKSENSIQRKILKVALEELKQIEEREISTHPYLFYLRGLIYVALGKWEEATSQFHQATSYTHNPKLFKLLVNLYIQLDMPQVSRYFESKIRKVDKVQAQEVSA